MIFNNDNPISGMILSICKSRPYTSKTKDGAGIRKTLIPAFMIGGKLTGYRIYLYHQIGFTYYKIESCSDTIIYTTNHIKLIGILGIKPGSTFEKVERK